MTGGVDELRYTLGLVYKADTPDAHGEYMTREELRKAAWDYAVNAHETGVFHVDGTGGTGVPVESFLWPDGAPDWEVKDPDGNTVVVIKSGDWLMGNLWSQGAWDLIKSGRINGLSMQGVAVRRESPASVTKSRGRPPVTAKTKATGVPVQLVKAKIDRVDGVDGPANEVPFLLMKAAVLPDDEDEMQPEDGDGVTVEVSSGEDGEPAGEPTGDEAEPAEVEPGETPGDAAWETQDSKSAEKAASLLAGIKAQIDDLIKREMAESEDADVSMLEMACSDLDWVLGIIAKFVFTEQAEADAAKENPPTDDTEEAGDGSATDEEEAEDVTKAVEEIKVHFEGLFADLKKSLTEQVQGAQTSTEATATAATEVAKSSETDVSDVLKSVLGPALEPITKAVEQVSTSLAGVSERLSKVEAQDAKGQPLLKGSAYWGGPAVPANYAGMQPEALTKALAEISNPQERDKVGQALALAQHPLMAKQQ